jgi:glutaredoxin
MKVKDMQKFLLMVLITAFSSGLAQAETLFRWVDKDGKVHYGDSRPAESVKVERKSFSDGAEVADDELPYEVRQAKQNFPVTLYSSGSCGNLCIQASSFLERRGIPFSEKVLKTPDEIESAKKRYGISAVPTLTIGKTVLSGFSEEAWSSELDLAGYPKTKPYNMRAPTKKPANQESPESGTEAQPAENQPAGSPGEIAQ